MKHLTAMALSLLIISPAIAGSLIERTPDYLARRLSGADLKNVELEDPEQSYVTAANSTPGVPDFEVVFTSASPWLSGVYGTVSNSFRIPSAIFTGSALSDSQIIPIRIDFSNTTTSLCGTFRRDLGYAAGGVGVFPGTAWDMSDTANPRQLNVCFVEDASQGAVNGTWDPNTTSVGKREYLFVMLSNYDGTGLTYGANNIFSDGSTMDILYFYWPQVTPGFTLLQTLPATIDIFLYNVKAVRVIPDATENIFTWRYEDTDPDHFNVYAGTTDPPSLITTVPGSARGYTHSSLTTGVQYYYYAEAASGSNATIASSKQVSETAHSVASNVNLLGYLHDYDTYGDIWGYTSGSTEYALICARNLGVSIIDVTADPPVEVGFITPLVQGVDSKDIKIYQNYAILVNESDDIQFFDITDVTNPTYVSSFTPDGGGSHNCLIEGSYMYVIGNHGVGGLEIVDISNPLAPVEVGQFQPFYYHDIDIRNDTLIGTGIYGDGIDLIDVSNKSAPSLIARFNYPGSGAHNAEFSADGSHVFIGDEIGTGNYIRTFNVSDPMNVSLASTMIIDTNQVVHNCYLLDDTLLAIGHYTLGMRVWNVADPANPSEVAYYDTHETSVGGYSGCWSVYTEFASGKIIASDMQTGLYVLETEFAAAACPVTMTGDVDLSGTLTSADLITMVNYVFKSGPDPQPCAAAADADCSGTVTSSDVIYMVNHVFKSGPLPCDICTMIPSSWSCP